MVVLHLRSQFVKHQRVNRCSFSMPWIRVQELSQQQWPLLLVTAMYTLLHLLLLSYLWYSPILGFRRVVLHMHQFAFFSLSSLLSFGMSISTADLVQVLHRDIARVPSQGLFRHTNHWVRPISAENKRGCRDTYPVQGPPCVSSRATNRAVSYSDREFSPLGALSRMVSERTLPPYLYPAYWHTPPQHRIPPLSLKTRCCLATSSKSLVVQLAQYNKSMVTVSWSSNMADRKLIGVGSGS